MSDYHQYRDQFNFVHMCKICRTCIDFITKSQTHILPWVLDPPINTRYAICNKCKKNVPLIIFDQSYCDYNSDDKIINNLKK